MFSFRKKVKTYWDLFRFEHGLMMGLGVLIGYFASSPAKVEFLTLSKGFFVALFLEMAGFALNDYFDYLVDLENKRFDRPLIRGEIRKEQIIPISIFLFSLGLSVSLTINFLAFIFSLILAILAILYDWKVKKRKYLGNQYIAVTMAAPFLFGSLISTGRFVSVTIILASMAYLVGVGREIMKDVVDLDGDVKQGITSLPSVLGVKNSLKIASVLLFSSTLLSPVPLTLTDTAYYMNPLYAVPVSITDLGLIYTSFETWRYIEKRKLNDLRKETLIILIIGLIGFFLGAFRL